MLSFRLYHLVNFDRQYGSTDIYAQTCFKIFCDHVAKSVGGAYHQISTDTAHDVCNPEFQYIYEFHTQC